MAVKKSDEKEKKVVHIKATTGAWWKSTTKEAVAEKASPGEKAAEKKEAEKKKAPTTARKKAPAGTSQKKTTASATKTKKDTRGTAVTEEKKTAPPKKSSGRRPARKKKPPVSGETLEAAKEGAEKEVVFEAVSDGPATPESLQEDKVAAEAAPKKSRGRRGRRGTKKTSSPEKTETDSPAVKELLKEVESPSGAEKPGGADTKTDAKPAATKAKPKKEKAEEEPKKVSKLLINAEEPEECRLALLEDGRLESIHVSTVSSTHTKSNIYKARIVAIEPSLQAAFVDYGTEKNGFLPFSEIHPEYYKQNLPDDVRHKVENNQWKKISITEVVERGQEILAQVVKEEIGKKGANMTTYLSIPGRCVVLMPGSDSAGISRKISGEKRRSQLRDTMVAMDLPEGIGWIVRTASVDITKEALTRDAEYLLELWGEIKSRGQKMDGVGLVYKDQQSVLRFLREHFDPSIQEILVDDHTALKQVKEFVKMLPEQQRNVNIRYHQGARPIFNQYSVEDQIESIYQPHVNLPSGGSIVIDPTEALVAIDVNSGSTSKGKNFEASIFQANMEAARELARQLRLRDLGGLVVVDFIDMRNKKNILAVEREVKAAMKRDKAKVDFSRISKFGLMQISRQKLGAPIEAGNYLRCDHCKGRGMVRSVETLSLYYLRRIQTGASRKPVEKIECHLPLDVASYLLNNKRSELCDLEKRYHVEISLFAEATMKPGDNDIVFHKAEKESNSKKQA